MDAHLAAIDEQIEAWQRESAAAQALKNPRRRRLISAALAAHVPDPPCFVPAPTRWLGWPGPSTELERRKGQARQDYETGQSLLRRFLVLGATASLRWLNKRTDPLAVWTRQLLQRRPARLVTVALANKLARIAWAIMTTGELYRRKRRSLSHRARTSNKFARDGDEIGQRAMR